MTDKELKQLQKFSTDIIKKTRLETRKECFEVMGEAIGYDLGNPEDVKKLQNIVKFGENQLIIRNKIADSTIKAVVGSVVLALGGLLITGLYTKFK